MVSRTEGNSIRKVAQEAGVDERHVHEWKKMMELEVMLSDEGKTFCKG